jgi:alanine dehydrogenase
MKIGIPKEIKPAERRVAATPANVKALLDHGHRVLLERGAGIGSGFPDEASAQIPPTSRRIASPVTWSSGPC